MRTIAAPMPREPPVTTATLPSSESTTPMSGMDQRYERRIELASTLRRHLPTGCSIHKRLEKQTRVRIAVKRPLRMPLHRNNVMAGQGAFDGFNRVVIRRLRHNPQPVTYNVHCLM